MSIATYLTHAVRFRAGNTPARSRLELPARAQITSSRRFQECFSRGLALAEIWCISLESGVISSPARLAKNHQAEPGVFLSGIKEAEPWRLSSGPKKCRLDAMIRVREYSHKLRGSAALFDVTEAISLRLLLLWLLYPHGYTEWLYPLTGISQKKL